MIVIMMKKVNNQIIIETPDSVMIAIDCKHEGMINKVTVGSLII